MNERLLKMLREQSAMELDAHAVYLALSLWAKTKGWAGSHKWFGRQSLEERTHCKRFLKFLADYVGEPATLPATEEKPCEAGSLEDAYRSALDLEITVTESLRQIAQYADELGAMDVEAFVSEFLIDQIQSVKRLRRFVAFLSDASGDPAALFAFDHERK